MSRSELRGVVDDDAEDDPGGGVDDAWDWDKICPYRTYKMVRIRDNKLGVLYWGIVTCVVMYIIVIVFYFQGRHAEQDTGISVSITKLSGKAFSGSKVYDSADLRFPVIEPSGAFVMTRRIVVKDQTRGRCVDWDDPKHCPCAEGDVCTDGMCEVLAWCPSLGDGNAADPPAGAVVENMTGLERSVLQITTGITFPNIGNALFVTGQSESGKNFYRNVTLGTLLSLAEPPLTIEDVLPRGALLGVSFNWNCDVTWGDPCEPHVVTQRLDGGQGFVQKRVRHQQRAGQETRDAIYMFGLRILVESSGIGRRISPMLVVVQIGSGVALMKLASMAADFAMLWLYSEERRKAYYKCKICETKDFSDLRDRLHLVQEKRPEGRSLLRHGRLVSHGSGGGGLGMGGRSPTLRGRGTAV